MTGQHEPLWKPEAKSGAPEGKILRTNQVKMLKFIVTKYIILTLTNDQFCIYKNVVDQSA